MTDKYNTSQELKELTDEQFEDTSFWSGMLNEPEDPSFVERPDRTEGFLDDQDLPIQTEDTTQQREQSPSEQTIQEKRYFTKKRIIIGSTLIIVVLILASFMYTLFLNPQNSTVSGKKESISHAQDASEEKNVTIETKEVERLNTVWEPFWLRLQKDGKEVFVTLSFTTTTTNPKVIQEIKHKEIFLRDAIYYYLKNIQLSTNKETIEKIKKDVIEILNTHISSGSVESIGMETFFVH